MSVTLSATITELLLSETPVFSPPKKPILVKKLTQIYSNTIYIKVVSEYSTPDNQIVSYLPLIHLSESSIMMLDKLIEVNGTKYYEKQVIVNTFRVDGHPENTIQTFQTYLLGLIEKELVFIDSQPRTTIQSTDNW
jgi:hypothetical protein